MPPSCSRCNADAVAIAIPDDLVDVAPVDTASATVCRVCLTLDPLDEVPADTESIRTVSEAFPDDREAAAGIAILVALLESLALNRAAIEGVIDHLEAAGIDALLVISRLRDDPDVRPAVDLDRRLHQLEQLLV